jgi:hypothetical protein
MNCLSQWSRVTVQVKQNKYIFYGPQQCPMKCLIVTCGLSIWINVPVFFSWLSSALRVFSFLTALSIAQLGQRFWQSQPSIQQYSKIFLWMLNSLITCIVYLSWLFLLLVLNCQCILCRNILAVCCNTAIFLSLFDKMKQPTLHWTRCLFP